MDEQAQHGQQDGFADGGLSARIVPLRRREGGARAERIASVVDAFGRLRGSVVRFVALLARRDAAAPVSGEPDVMPFEALLQALAAHAERTCSRVTPAHPLPADTATMPRGGRAIVA